MIIFLQSLLFLFMVLLSLFLILVVLIQRGKGGGLVGAFGGMGGNSAFGTKSSDVFVRITVISAIIWFTVCIGGRYILLMHSPEKAPVEGRRTAQAPLVPPTQTTEPVSDQGTSAPQATPSSTTEKSDAAPAPAAATAPTATPAPTAAPEKGTVPPVSSTTEKGK